MQGSSSGMAAPTPFWSGYIYIIFHNTNIEASCYKPETYAMSFIARWKKIHIYMYIYTKGGKSSFKKMLQLSLQCFLPYIPIPTIKCLLKFLSSVVPQAQCPKANSCSTHTCPQNLLYPRFFCQWKIPQLPKPEFWEFIMSLSSPFLTSLHPTTHRSCISHVPKYPWLF